MEILGSANFSGLVRLFVFTAHIFLTPRPLHVIQNGLTPHLLADPGDKGWQHACSPAEPRRTKYYTPDNPSLNRNIPAMDHWLNIRAVASRLVFAQDYSCVTPAPITEAAA